MRAFMRCGVVATAIKPFSVVTGHMVRRAMPIIGFYGRAMGVMFCIRGRGDHVHGLLWTMAVSMMLFRILRVAIS